MINENKKRSMVLIIIAIATLALIVAGAAYAYFDAGIHLDEGELETNVATAAKTYSFTAKTNETYSDGKIEIDVLFNDMSEVNISTEKIKSDSAGIDVSLASPREGVVTTCTYDIIWVWDGEDKYTAPEAGITLPYTHTDGEVYNYEFSTKVDGGIEKDLSSLEAGTTANSVVLKSGATIISTGTNAEKQTHVVESNIYNLPVEQKKLQGKNFSAHLTVENINCEMTTVENANGIKILSSYITDTVYNSSSNQSSIASRGAGVYKHDATLTNGAKDNSYRYAGGDEDVNNYICFYGDDCTDENNLYRIISVDSNNKIKVIKATSLGDMEWNEKTGYIATGTAQDLAIGLTTGNTYTNIWAVEQAGGSYYTSSLNDYLNGEFLQGLGIKANLIETTTWSVGGVGYDDTMEKIIHDFMIVELSNTATYPAKVGLMYASDYGFAALPEYWTIELHYYERSYGNDWLFVEGHPWISLRNSDFNDCSFHLSDAGDVNDDGGIVNLSSFAILPSFNLSSSVKLLNAIEEGVGSKTNPMILF